MEQGIGGGPTILDSAFDMKTQWPNFRAGADAGLSLLLELERQRPGTAQHGRSAKKMLAGLFIPIGMLVT